MICKTKAAVALQDGCRRLGLSSSTATALVQFLSVKRTHDQYVAAESRKLHMSPGAQLDRLWHFMLLNTAVSSVGHEQLGGVVAHRGVDSTDLPDEVKLLQRLYALNIMRLEGTEPDVALWTDPGTSMHTLHLTASPVPDLQHLPGGGRLYVTPNLTQQQQAQLVQALALLYAQDQQDASGSYAQQKQRHARMLSGGATAAPAPAAADAQPPAKRACVANARELSETALLLLAERKRLAEHERRHPSKVGPILNLIVKDQLGGEVHYKVNSSTQLWKVMESYEARRDLLPDAYRMIFDGERVCQADTPSSLGMEDGDTMDCLVMQTGC